MCNWSLGPDEHQNSSSTREPGGAILLARLERWSGCVRGEREASGLEDSPAQKPLAQQHRAILRNPRDPTSRRNRAHCGAPPGSALDIKAASPECSLCVDARPSCTWSAPGRSAEIPEEAAAKGNNRLGPGATQKCADTFPAHERSDPDQRFGGGRPFLGSRR